MPGGGGLIPGGGIPIGAPRPGPGGIPIGGPIGGRMPGGGPIIPVDGEGISTFNNQQTIENLKVYEINLSDLGAGLRGPLEAGLLVQEDTAWELLRCSPPLLLQPPCLCPVGSSPEKHKLITPHSRCHYGYLLRKSCCYGYLLRRSAHSSDRTCQSSRSLWHRSSGWNATTCSTAHARTSSHTRQRDTSNTRLSGRRRERE